MAIDVTIVVGDRGRILVNPNPIPVPSGRIEEIRWRVLGSPGWDFRGGVAGITIHGAGAASTFLKPLYTSSKRQVSVMDLNSNLGMIQGGKRLKAKKKKFKYDISLVRRDPNGKVIDTAELDPTIENQGC